MRQQDHSAVMADGKRAQHPNELARMGAVVLVIIHRPLAHLRSSISLETINPRRVRPYISVHWKNVLCMDVSRCFLERDGAALLLVSLGDGVAAIARDLA